MGPVGEVLSMKKIPLTQGKFAIVDDEDYPYLSRFKWGLDQNGNPIRNDTQQAIKMVNLLICGNTEITHINMNRLDCRKNNLLKVTHSQASHRGKRKGTAIYSKYQGVTYEKNHWNTGKAKIKPWRAYITCDYKRYWLGWFKTEIEAALVYNKKAIELYGEFAYQNKI